MWDTWFTAMVVLFIIIVSWIVVTPVYNQLSTAIYNAGSYSDVSTNTSMHSLVDYNDNTWNKWPLVAAVIIFLIIFYFAVEDKPVYTRGY